MSEKKKVLKKLYVAVIAGIILTVILQVITSKIVTSTECGIVISTIIFWSIIEFIIGDIINSIESDEQYLKRFHIASAKMGIFLLIDSFIGNIIIEKTFSRQYNYIEIWSIVLIATFIITVHFGKKVKI